MHNPFRAIVKADDLSPALAATLFVPEASPIWSDLQHPINHIVVGPRGAGKTIALKQLDYRTQESQDRTPQYAGIYIQISRISTIFKTLFTTSPQDRDSLTTAHFQRVFSDYLWLEIARELGTFLLHHAPRVPATRSRSLLKQMTGLDVHSVDDLHDYCATSHLQIEQQIQSWSIDKTCSWRPLGDLSASLHRVARVLREFLPDLRRDRPCLYVLVDESAPIPIECQAVINGLLHRGRPYCVKLAIRPFEWETLHTSSGARIELDTDVAPLHIHYPNELQDAYVSRMRSVVNRVLQTQGLHGQETPPTVHLDIDEILVHDRRKRYSGFPSICAASSGNPQNLLLICSSIFTAAGAQRVSVPQDDGLRLSGRLQDDAVRLWSKDYEDHNPYGDARAFCRALLKTIRNSRQTPRTIGFTCVPDAPDLFAPDYLPDDVGNRIKSAFSGGFLRNTQPETTSLFDAPARFHISRGLLPREGLDLTLPILPEVPLDRSFLIKHAKEFVGGRAAGPSTIQGTIHAFLSVSFSDLLQQQRADIKHLLGNVGIECKDVGDVARQFLFSAIYREILRADVTILDATILRPFTMFEVGLCAGATKRKGVICIVNDSDEDDAVERLFEPLRKLPILTFSFSDDRLPRLAAEIGARTRELLTGPSEFSKVALTGVSLRPRKPRDKAVYVSLPDSPLRARALETIAARLEPEGWDVILEEDVATYTANEFQVAIQCAYMSRVGVIDTSGKEGPDLMQCYKLGLFPGKRNWRVLRTEQKAHSRREVFATVPSMNYFCWSTFEELANGVARFLKAS